MNPAHLEICASPEWAQFVEDELLPWALGVNDLGDDALEVGAGPGCTTDVLRRRVQKLTAIEVDLALAEALAKRLAGTNVEVVHADATHLPFDNGRFSAATSFTMLHHVPSVEKQDEVLHEVRRVLRPGGLFVGTDSIDRPDLRALHEDDTFVPVDPELLPDRLAAAGFTEIVVDKVDERFRFTAKT